MPNSTTTGIYDTIIDGLVDAAKNRNVAIDKWCDLLNGNGWTVAAFKSVAE